MWSSRRICALVTVLALLLSLVPAPGRRCTECPLGCPMHAHADDAGGQGRRRAGCHRGPAVPTGALTVRAACGGGAPAEAGTALPAVLPPGDTITPVLVAARAVAAPAAAGAWPAREVPTEPPRARRG